MSASYGTHKSRRPFVLERKTRLAGTLPFAGARADVNGMIDPAIINDANMSAFLSSNPREEVNTTYYDHGITGLALPFPQDNLRLRVASTTYQETAGAPLAFDHATHYSYDIHGNVKSMVQDIPQMGVDAGQDPDHVNQRWKRLNYSYDLISGNVKQVDYLGGQHLDQMHHRYSYDADNRITNVETSADKAVWHTDAEYFYYPHGPLERVELGEYKVQGTDYAYTLQGWLKGINGDALISKTDIGQDGVPGTANEFVGRDAYGESIGYYGVADYSAIDPDR